jgi:hypothetical protein
MNQRLCGERPARIFFYSTILPVAWISVCLAAYFLLPGIRLGIVGMTLLLMAVASLISWLFVRRHKRPFSKSEYWRLISYCTLWTLAFESLVLFFYIVPVENQDGSLDAQTLAFGLLVAVAVDFLLVWLAFRQTGRRVISWYLKQLGKEES